MSPSALNKTTEVIKVVCSMSLEEMPCDVKALEQRIIEKVHGSGRQFYAAVFAAFQQRWLQERRGAVKKQIPISDSQRDRERSPHGPPRWELGLQWEAA
jgi:hypothetical protein